ncbi:NAD-dependent epimerase [Paenibacillus sp. R14(2021)]|uniref:NAD-dependent epimerase n=1 Tax=Paenibacillus sp. R14(2021) TaxID=2859228 RepID=UPI001C6135D5|nr:NAD-dependent epimerase [Paenibacillus sp. R14(2021)]
MKVIVTGAAGFIGFHVSKRLLDEGHEVVGFDNLNAYYDVKLKLARLSMLETYEKFRFVEGQLEDAVAVLKLFRFEEFERVIHLAAQAGVRYSLENPHAYVQSNLAGFTSVLEGCRQTEVPHLLYASSSSVYGANVKMPFSESDAVDHPVSLYAATKKANELMAHTYSHLYNLPTTGLRFFTVYGPWGRPDMAYYSFTEKIVRGEPIKLFNHGRMRRDFTYIDDIVEGIVRLMDQPASPDDSWRPEFPNSSSSYAPYKVYNIGNNQPVELLRFVETLENLLGVDAMKELLPMQDGDVVETFADTRAIEQAVGFKPVTSIEEGLGRFISWYRTYNADLVLGGV